MDQNFLVQMLSYLGWEVECECCGSIISNENLPIMGPKHVPIVQQETDKLSDKTKNIKKDKCTIKRSNTLQIHTSTHQTDSRQIQNPLGQKNDINTNKVISKKCNINKKAKNSKKMIIWTREMDSKLLYLVNAFEKDWNLISIKMQVDINLVLARYKKLCSSSNYQSQSSDDQFSPCVSPKRQPFLFNDNSSTKNSNPDNIFDILSGSAGKTDKEEPMSPIRFKGFNRTPKNYNLVDPDVEYFMNSSIITPRKDT